MADEREYCAFLGCSHSGTRVCEWRHAALEGVVPTRQFPAFWDLDGRIVIAYRP